MSKNVFIVSASARKNGNSATLAAEFAHGAVDAGHNVAKVDLFDLKLNFCLGCLACQKSEKCIIDDDINGLLSTVQNSDVLVFATPIYYYGLAGQLKTFLDRLNPLFNRRNRFKEVYLLASAAEDDQSAFDKALIGLQGWIECFEGVELKGVVRAGGVTAVGDIQTTDFPHQAYELGRKN